MLFIAVSIDSLFSGNAGLKVPLRTSTDRNEIHGLQHRHTRHVRAFLPGLTLLHVGTVRESSRDTSGGTGKEAKNNVVHRGRRRKGEGRSFTIRGSPVPVQSRRVTGFTEWSRTVFPRRARYELPTYLFTTDWIPLRR